MLRWRSCLSPPLPLLRLQLAAASCSGSSAKPDEATGVAGALMLSATSHPPILSSESVAACSHTASSSSGGCATGGEGVICCAGGQLSAIAGVGHSELLDVGARGLRAVKGVSATEPAAIRLARVAMFARVDGRLVGESANSSASRSSHSHVEGCKNQDEKVLS
jgi:hypothetical protein